RSGAILTGDGGVMNGSALLESGSSLSFDLRAANDYDALEILSLTLEEGVDLQLDLAYVFGGSEIFTLIQGNYAGTFTTINGNAFDEGNSFTLNYDGTDHEFQLIYGANMI